MLPLTLSGQPLEISLERLGQPMSLYVPLSKGAPLTAGSMGTYAEFVIAVADGGFLRRLRGLHNLAQYERPLKWSVSVVAYSPPWL
jgi:hypothetical protein